MNQPPSIYSNLSDQTKFRLNKINKIKYYFNAKVPVGISDASFSLIWYLLEKLLKITRNKKET